MFSGRLRQQVDIFRRYAGAACNSCHNILCSARLSNGNANCLKTIGLAQHFRFHFAAENFPAGQTCAGYVSGCACNTAGVAPCEALHIGDHPVDDMQGAQAVGMKTLWVNFAETPWPLATAAPDLTVTSLPMILEALLPPAR
jgi:FMN phosphatase YigB (HAD superfamily)